MRKFLVSFFFILLPFVLLAQSEGNRITLTVEKLEKFKCYLNAYAENSPISIEGGTTNVSKLGRISQSVEIIPTEKVVTIIGDVSSLSVRDASEYGEITGLIADGHSTLSVVLFRNNALKKLVLTNCPELHELRGHNNCIETVNLEGSSKLKTIKLQNNQIKEFNLDGFPHLKKLYLDGNPIKKLDVEKLPELSCLYLGDAKELSEIDLSKNPKLEWLSLTGNTKMRVLDLTANSEALVYVSTRQSNIHTVWFADELCPNYKDFNAAGSKLSFLTPPKGLSQVGKKKFNVSGTDMTADALNAFYALLEKDDTNSATLTLLKSAEDTYKDTVRASTYALMEGKQWTLLKWKKDSEVLDPTFFEGNVPLENAFFLDFRQSDRGEWRVTVNGEVVSPRSAIKKGDKIVATFKPKSGCEVSCIFFNGKPLSSLEKSIDVAEPIRNYIFSVPAETLIPTSVAPSEIANISLVDAADAPIDYSEGLAVGQTVKVKVEAKSGKCRVVSIEVNGKKLAGSEFTVSAEESKYEIVVNAVRVLTLELSAVEHGALKVFNGSAQLANGAEIDAGTELRFEAEPSDGYELSKIMVNDKPIDGLKYALPADAESCVVKAMFKEKSSAGKKPTTAVCSDLLAGILVSPNPFHAAIQVLHAESVLRYALYNSLGQLIISGVHDGSNLILLNGEALPMGIYLLRLDAADGARVIRVVRDR